MITLPETWQSCTLDDIARIVSGGTPKSTVEDNFCETGGIAWLTPADLSGYKAKTISKGKRNLTDKGYQSCSAKKMPKGSVLYSSRAPIGYVVIAENEISTNQGFKSFIPDKGIDSEYLYHYLKSIKHIAEANATGTTFKELSGTATKALPFIAPPATEQKRIVEKLDSLLAQVDTIQQRLNNLPDIIKRFRQSVLAAAVSGKLTEQWREKKPQKSANKILIELARVREAQFEKEIEDGNKETKRLLSKINKHNPDLPTIELPNSWVWTSFMASMEKVVDCHNKTAPYIDEGIPLIRTPDIRDGKISLKGAKYISQETYDYWSRRCPPKSGDIIFTREAPMGEAGIVPKGTVLCMGQRMMLLRPMKEFINPEYVLLNILSLNFQERMNEDAIGTGVKHLRVADVEALSYPLAPLEEQTEIVRLVEQYFALADTLEKNLTNAKQRVDNLTQSILAKAFRGELVPQDLNDEPADKLLARIKAARLEAEKLEIAAKKAAKASKK